MFWHDEGVNQVKEVKRFNTEGIPKNGRITGLESKQLRLQGKMLK